MLLPITQRTMDKKLFKEFAALQAKVKEAEAKLAQAKLAVLDELAKDEIDTFDSPFGRFTRATRTTYAYSDAVKKLEEKVKLAKVKEEQQGLVKVKSQTEYLVFKA
jgi:hypothetical protein